MAINNPLKKVATFLGFSTKEDKRQDYANEVSIDERRQIFKINESYYSNNVYDRLIDGGALDLINDFLGEAKDNNIKGMFNPVKRVVEVYAENVFGGKFGQDILIAPYKINGEPIHPNLQQAVQKIASWSNFDQELKQFVRYGAMQGTVGIRVVSKVGTDFPNDRPEERRVYLEFEHPATIINALRDRRGNVKSIITEYVVNQGELSLSGRGESVRQAIVRELMTKEFIERRTEANGIVSILPFNFGGKEQQRLTNVLKVVPYVIVHHEKKTGLFGSWCFQGVERKIDLTNALSSHLDKQIIRHVKATWAIASSGEAPQEIKMSGNNILWFELGEGVASPTIQSMVAQLSISETLQKISQHLDEIADSLPELKATDGKYLSGQSGETIAQLRLPAEVKIKSARTSYEDGLIRAIKIGLSWGILLGIFDFGTGIGTKEAADSAFENGLLDFQFEERDALPITKSERLDLQQKELEVGALADEFLGETTETIQPVEQLSGNETDIVDESDIVATGIEEG